MKPLFTIALGVVIVALYDPLHGFDLLPDPFGWILILAGVSLLARKAELPQQRTLNVLGVGALVASSVLWWPSARDWLTDADASLGWAIELPRFLFCALLCHALSVQARKAEESVATGWTSWTAIGFAISTIAPVLVIGGDVEALAGPTAAVVSLSQVSLFVLCLVYANRPWAGAEPVSAA